MWLLKYQSKGHSDLYSTLMGTKLLFSDIKINATKRATLMSAIEMGKDENRNSLRKHEASINHDISVVVADKHTIHTNLSKTSDWKNP